MARILVVEDDVNVARLLLTFLENKDHHVTVIGAGPAAVSEALQNPPDLILLDIAIPAMSGIEVCQRLRKVPDTALTPIIILSAHPTEENRERAINAGADRFVAKPFSLARLAETMDALLLPN